MALLVGLARMGRPYELSASESESPFNHLDPALIIGLGRGAQASIPVGYSSLWVCVQGSVQITGSGFGLPLHAGQAYISSEPKLRLTSLGDAQWAGLAGTPIALECYLGSDSLGQPAPIYSSLEQAGPDLMRAAEVVVARAGEHGDSDLDCGCLVEQFADLVRNVVDRIATCPGRCQKTRRLSYQRLLRARNRIASDPSTIDSVDVLATMASYSSWHFIRVFHRVFGETPMEYSHRLRLDRARQLIQHGQLSVSEVARETGFETFSAFCRSFRTRFGTTATALRQRAQHRVPRPARDESAPAAQQARNRG